VYIFKEEEVMREAIFANDVVAVQELLVLADINKTIDGNGTPLMYAAANGRIDLVVYLLTIDGVDVNIQHAGHTAFILAVMGGHIDVIEKLLEVEDIDINIKGLDEIRGHTALTIACGFGHVSVVAKLLEVGSIDVNIKHEKPLEQTALMIAAENGYIGIVDELLKAKDIDVNLSNGGFFARMVSLPSGFTALMSAAKNGHGHVVNSLLAVEGIHLNAACFGEGNTALMWAARGGYGDIVRQLVASGVDVYIKNKEGQTVFDIPNIMPVLLISLALEENSVSIKHALSLGNSLDAALINAAERNNVTEVRALLKQYKAAGTRVLIEASQNSRVRVVKALLAANVEGINTQTISYWNKTPLIMAAKNGSEAIVRELVNAGADIHVISSFRWGHTALSFAAAKDRLNIVKFLSFHIMTTQRDTAIEILAKTIANVGVVTGYNAAYKFLVSRHAMLNAGLSLGSPNISVWSAKLGHTEIVKYLLSLGLYRNERDNYGRIPLVHAAEKGHIATVKLLSSILSAADANLVDNYGQTACTSATLDVAKYLMYSGKVLYSGNGDALDHALAITRLEQLYSDMPDERHSSGCYRFLVRIRDMLSPLSAAIIGNIVAPFPNLPNRINLLAARVCGVRFAENHTVRHTGMTMPKFMAVSYLMRAATITKLVGGFNSYLVMRTLMLRATGDNILAKLPFDLRAKLLDFFAEGDVGFIMQELSPIQSVPPALAVMPVAGHVAANIAPAVILVSGQAAEEPAAVAGAAAANVAY
jgi:ankyrin repeat protein